MAFLNASNNAETKLVSDITSTATSLTVEDSSIFPAPPFLCSIDDEIIKVTAVNGNNFEGLERGQEGTTPAEHLAGRAVENRYTAGMYHDTINAITGLQTNLQASVEGLMQDSQTQKENIRQCSSRVDGVENDLAAHKAEYTSLLAGGDIIEAVLQNGWTGTLRYTKNKLGQVFLYGDIIPGTVSNGTTITDLPIEYKPIAGASAINIPAYGTSGTKTITGLTLFRSSLGLSVYNTNAVEGQGYIRFGVMYQADK